GRLRSEPLSRGGGSVPLFHPDAKLLEQLLGLVAAELVAARLGLVLDPFVELLLHWAICILRAAFRQQFLRGPESGPAGKRRGKIDLVPFWMERRLLELVEPLKEI